jgi:hypothetical protein
MAFRINGFAGVIPGVDTQLLAYRQAAVAVNCRLTDGDIVALEAPLFVTRPNKSGTAQTIYRLVNGATEYWFSWPRDVNIAKGPVAGDTLQRHFYTGDGEPRMTTLADAISGGANDYPHTFFVMGVTKPVTKATVTPSGGSGATTSRAYVYTFVTPYGEESAPSPDSGVINGKVDDTWALSAMDTAPPNSGSISGATSSAGITTLTVNTTRSLRAGEEVVHASVAGMTDLNGTFAILAVTDATHYTVSLTTAQTYTSGGTWTRVAAHNVAGMVKRIYRTVGGTFFFVAEIAVATTTYNDTLTDAVVSGQGVLKTVGWEMPPADMKALVQLANGILAGISGNVVCFAEPFVPYAWPVAYQQALPFQTVAMTASGSSAIVATTDRPYVFTGTHPSSMSQDKPDVDFPCAAKRGMVGISGGSLYPTRHGLALVGPGVANIATMSLYTTEQWAALNPSSFISAYHKGRYYGACIDTLDNAKIIIIESGQAAQVIESNVLITGIYNDPISGSLYIVEDGDIKQWDADAGERLIFEWLSKEFVLPKPVNMAAADVDFDSTQSDAERDALQAAFNAILLANQALAGQANIVRTGTLVSGIAVVINLATTDYLVPWMSITGTGVPGSTKIKSIDNSTQITMTANASSSGTPSLTFTGSEDLLDGALNSSALNVLQLNASRLQAVPPLTFDLLQFALYVDGSVKYSRQVTNKKPFALPGGYKSDTVAVKLSGNVRVRSVVLAESMKGLGSV